MTDGLVAVTPIFQAGVDIVFVGVDQSALGDGLLDDRLDRHLLNIGQQVENNLTAALDQGEDGRFFLLESAATRGAPQPPPPPASPLFSTLAGWPL